MKYEHDVIRDLMPLCIDGIASEKSREAVSEHIAECSDCAKEWEMMQKKIDIDKEPEITAETADTTTAITMTTNRINTKIPIIAS